METELRNMFKVKNQDTTTTSGKCQLRYNELQTLLNTIHGIGGSILNFQDSWAIQMLFVGDRSLNGITNMLIQNTANKIPVISGAVWWANDILLFYLLMFAIYFAWFWQYPYRFDFSQRQFKTLCASVKNPKTLQKPNAENIK